MGLPFCFAQHFRISASTYPCVHTRVLLSCSSQGVFSLLQQSFVIQLLYPGAPWDCGSP